MKYLVTLGDRCRTVEIDSGGVRIDDRAVNVDVARIGDTSTFSVVVEGRTFSVVGLRSGRGRWQLQAGGHDLSVDVVDERTARLREFSPAGRDPGTALSIKAPMPGMVVKVEVSEGDLVTAGQGLIIVEAMKMENELRAHSPGRVARILTASGQAVEKDQILIELSGDEDS